ncbi:hypothetical protein ACLK11_09895 [Escherichia coli]
MLLIVNVASKCGLTPQYEQLENIQKAWADQRLWCGGIPVQPVSGKKNRVADEEIKTYCTTTWG